MTEIEAILNPQAAQGQVLTQLKTKADNLANKIELADREINKLKRVDAVAIITLTPMDFVLNGKYQPGSEVLVLCDATNGAFAPIMPDAISARYNKFTFVKTDSSTNVITLTGSIGQLINGVNTFPISIQYSMFSLISNVVGWSASDAALYDSLDARIDTIETMWTRNGTTISFVNTGDTLDVRGPAVFNEAGADYDFRIEGDTDANLFSLDASTDRIGIGTSTPTNKFTITGTETTPVRIINSGGTTAQIDIEGTAGATFFGNANGTHFFGGTSGASANNVNLTSSGLGVGVLVPAAKIESLSATEQLRLSNTASFYTGFTIDSAGSLSVAPIGGHLYLQKVAAGSTHLNVIPKGANDGKLFIYSSDVLADATNYELFELFKSNAGNAKIKVSKGGTGTYRNLELYTNNALQVTLDTSGNLGVGVSASIGARIHSLSTAEQLRLAYSSTIDTSFTVASSGDTTIKLNDGVNLNFDLAGNGSGGDFNFYSPDAIGSRINFFAYDSGSAKQKYATVNMYIADSTAGSEDGGIEFKVVVAGSETPIVAIAGAGLTMNTGAVFLKSYTVAGVPSASVAGGMIYVSNETGGAVPAFSDGTNWRRVTDRAVVA